MKEGKALDTRSQTIAFALQKYIKTTTTDNGTDFSTHPDITAALGVTVIFAVPYASWQKESIEKPNKLKTIIFKASGL